MGKRKSEAVTRAKVAAKSAQLAVGATSGTPAGLATAAAALVDLFEAVKSIVEQEKRRKIEALLQEAFFANAPDAGSAMELAALLERPSFRRVVVEVVRAKLEALADEEVTIPLVMILREYERTDREPDWFFRGFCRVLQDLSAAEPETPPALRLEPLSYP